MLRFSANPTADMNINDLRNAIFNYMLAKQRGEYFLIRIEDIDTEKEIDGKDQEILDILNHFGIVYDQLQHQSDNIKYHRAIAMQMLTEKKSFACFCPENTDDSKPYDETCTQLSDAEVIDNPNPFVVRIKKPDNSNEVDSFIILKVNKMPSINFSSAVDDMLSDVSLILDTEQNLSNAPKQTHVRDQIGYDKKIEYIHIPALEDDNTSIKELFEQGFIPDAIANYLISAGSETAKEIFTMQDAIEWFDVNTLSKTPIKFDIEKLRFFNRKHLELLDNAQLSASLNFSGSDIGKLAKLYLSDKVSTLSELQEKLGAIFAPKKGIEGFVEECKVIKDALVNAPFHDNFTELEKYLMEKSGLSGKKFLTPLRATLTGEIDGPELSDIYPLIKHYLGEIVK